MFGPALDGGSVPQLSNAIFQGMFACVTSALMIGSLADRGRTLPAIVFVFIWSTLVYDPIACWTWNSNGWASKMGYLDYAGGTPVHVASGFGALALSLMLGKKSETRDEVAAYKPHSIMFVVIGTFFMWVGWFGFNTGTSLVPTTRAVQALLNTQVSASFGGLTWAIMDFRLARKWSVVGFCSGLIAGLVAITPAAGYVPTWAAVISGVLGGMSANVGTKLKFFLKIDDSLDVFAVHGLGAIVGNIITGLFASKTIAALDGTTQIEGGWLDRHYIQLGYQLAGTVSAAFYSFFVTLLILFVINNIPGLHLRVTPEEEEEGLDFVEHDEFAFDYVELFPQLPLIPPEGWNDNTEDHPSANEYYTRPMHEYLSGNGLQVYNGQHKSDVDLEGQALDAHRQKLDDNDSPEESIRPTNNVFKSFFSGLKKSDKPSSNPADLDIELTQTPSIEKRHSIPADHTNDFVPMSINKNSASHGGPQSTNSQRPHYEFRSNTTNTVNSFNEISMFPNRKATGLKHPSPTVPMYPMDHEYDSAGRMHNKPMSSIHPSSAARNSLSEDHLAHHHIPSHVSQSHHHRHHPNHNLSDDESHEAIEGFSTYRRIQDQLDFSRWRGRFKQVGAGLLSRNNSIISGDMDRFSNLSPTATGNQPPSAFPTGQNSNAAPPSFNTHPHHTPSTLSLGAAMSSNTHLEPFPETYEDNSLAAASAAGDVATANISTRDLDTNTSHHSSAAPIINPNSSLTVDSALNEGPGNDVQRVAGAPLIARSMYSDMTGE